MVEDVVTSGGAALEAVDALRAAGPHCETVVCVVDRRRAARRPWRPPEWLCTPFWTPIRCNSAALLDWTGRTEKSLLKGPSWPLALRNRMVERNLGPQRHESVLCVW